MAEYRERYGFRQVPLEVGPPRPRLNATTTRVQDSYAQDATHHPDVVEAIRRGASYDAVNEIIARVTAEIGQARPLPGREEAVAENRRYHNEVSTRGGLSPAAADFRTRHLPGGPPGSDLAVQARSMTR